MKNPCSTITDMSLPDEVVEAAARAVYASDPESGYDVEEMHSHWRDKSWPKSSWDNWLPIGEAAIRAALQAMLDNGMAYEHYDGANAPVLSIKIRRLDADERKPALQEERK